MIKVAMCESTLGKNLINTSYAAEDGSNPTGIYQFTLGTYTDLAKKAGFPVQDDRLNHYRNVNLAAWAFANNESWRWECR